ncbi:SGNH/GDSL hydrolase family protein [Myxacorys almedinensis]|uniref:SGNH/GDSL hydrolase family protein n=1 Tax=Myxacorys almedinensis A TaxID=2690445 RepID=A0A8J8CJ78_9CYAN|nr:SGNH/GDSL hydrolase family protein [Myxacorys almedinensis]NDJ18723.1 SGNH/GDSL hydrolase family protein [Myxacorys almedinensis A]
MNPKIVFWIFIALGVAILSAELILRFVVGLGTPPLWQADEETGYQFQPNQEVYRFGKRIKFNQYSQRSDEIVLPKPSDTLRIMMLGDSVLNGGVFSDQQQTITELFKVRLAQTESKAESKVDVLNAAAGGWGIGNAVRYLQKFGTFESDVVIFQIGTSDLTQPMSQGKHIGQSPSFPDRTPSCAIEEAWVRYIVPRWQRLKKAAVVASEPASETSFKPLRSNATELFSQNMQTLKTAIQQLKAKQIPVIVLYTPNIDDVGLTGTVPTYKPEFFNLLNSLQVPVVDIQAAWANLPDTTIASYYADHIHPTETGNRAIADLLFQQLCTQSKSAWCRPSAQI